jgi:anti-sigma B factor antagonist
VPPTQENHARRRPRSPHRGKRRAITLLPLGDVDLSTAAGLRDAIVASFAEFDDIVCDLSQVGFMDAAGVSVLIDARRTATERGAQFAVVSPKGSVARILSLTGLAEALGVQPRADATSPITAPGS